MRAGAPRGPRTLAPGPRPGKNPPGGQILSRAKEVAGRRAAEFARDGMVLGLGTGSTVAYALDRLAERIRGEGLSVRGVPTSVATETRARELGIPLTDLEREEQLDLTIDGADEADPAFCLTKGGGGALLREKVVAAASRRVVICLGRAKLVGRLGRSFPLPVEVVPFARAPVRRRLATLGADVVLRGGEAEPFRTDNDNEILDCRFPDGIADPAALEVELDRIPGVVECGLFVGLAETLVVGGDDGTIELLERPAG